jgi:hypothetical protein
MPITNSSPGVDEYQEAPSEEGCITISSESDRNMQNVVEIVVTESNSRIESSLEHIENHSSIEPSPFASALTPSPLNSNPTE